MTILYCTIKTSFSTPPLSIYTLNEVFHLQYKIFEELHFRKHLQIVIKFRMIDLQFNTFIMKTPKYPNWVV